MRLDNSLEDFTMLPTAGGRLPWPADMLRGFRTLRTFVFLITDSPKSKYWGWFQDWRGRYAALRGN